MWRTRPILLLAIVGLLGLVGTSYYYRVQKRAGGAPKVPAVLPENISATAQRWTWKNTDKGRTTAEISATDLRQVRQPNEFALDGVELHIFNRDGDKYDQVKCAKASFDIATGEMFSDGDVEITMNVPADEAPSGKLLKIKSSGVHFFTKTGRAVTDRAANFEFDKGEGKAVGAEYDPQTRELHLVSRIELIWRGTNPKAPPMRIEGGDVRYKEAEGKVYLSPWSKLARDTLAMEGGSAAVTLNDGVISLVEAENAKGSDRQPKRSLDFAADHMVMNFNDDGQISQITGQPNAHLVSVTANGRTNVVTDHIDMNFDVIRKDDHWESKLKSAGANGKSVVESYPTAQPGASAPQNRILKSDIINVKMRPGGDEIESVETSAPGSLEFAPTLPTQPHRFVTGERMWIAYGPQNQIQTFRAIHVTTRTENPKQPDAKQPPPPVLTSSNDLNATFQAHTNDLARLEQTNNFRYESGDRKATADRADIDQVKNVINLSGRVRLSDSTGSTTAARIVMDQKNSDMMAEGDVNSVRLPDKNNQPSGMLSADEPLHATAQYMESHDRNLQLLYKGNAVAWQGANRLQASRIEIDRESNTVKANESVVSELIDKKDDKEPARVAKNSNQGPIFTVVHAADMFYTDDDHIARYTGGTVLTRPDLSVKAQEIVAYLRETNDPKPGEPPRPDQKEEDKNDSGSSLDHAFANGNVVVVSVSPLRTRTGTAEHAEYYEDDGKVILSKGKPVLVDTLKGTARGAELTWYSKDDRLLVNGVDKELAHSLLHRK